jgi:hypothetical protein
MDALRLRLSSRGSDVSRREASASFVEEEGEEVEHSECAPGANAVCVARARAALGAGGGPVEDNVRLGGPTVQLLGRPTPMRR